MLHCCLPVLFNVVFKISYLRSTFHRSGELWGVAQFLCCFSFLIWSVWLSSFQTLAGDLVSSTGKHGWTVMWIRDGEACVWWGLVGIECHPAPSSSSSLWVLRSHHKASSLAMHCLTDVVLSFFSTCLEYLITLPMVIWWVILSLGCLPFPLVEF